MQWKQLMRIGFSCRRSPVVLGRRPRYSNCKLGAEEQRKIKEPGPREDAMTTWEASESIVKEPSIWIRTNPGADQDPAIADALSVSAHSILLYFGKVRLTGIDAMRTRLAEQVFDGLRYEERHRD